MKSKKKNPSSYSNKKQPTEAKKKSRNSKPSEKNQSDETSSKKNPLNTLIGIIHLHVKGFGFVTAHDKVAFTEDIFIPKHLTQNAMDGDEVKISYGPSTKANKGPEGAVIEVTERKKNTLIGIIFDETPNHFMAFCPALGDKKMVNVKASPQMPLSVGDRVVLDIISWGEYPYLMQAKPLQILGSISDPSIDTEVAIREYGIKQEFPKPCLKEVQSYNKDPEEKDLKGRENLTAIETFTIDPDTAKDYDDALSLTKTKQGHYQLIVHIADVSHYVKRDAFIDKEANERALSAYFPGQCVPMLPEELSNGLCSLKENVIRLTISVFINFNENGDLLDHTIKKSYIKSQKRFTYKEAKQALDGNLPTMHLKTLQSMVDLCRLLQKKRKERGSVEFFLPEVVIHVDKKGNPTGHEVIEYDVTHQLVEEFMLKANELVAKELLQRNIPSIFRVHDAPTPQDMQEFYDYARALGFKVPAAPTPQDLQKLFEEAKTTPFLERLSIGFIRSMKLAIYSENNIGHYGLSLEHYTHFTSPIRRYSDLIIHRLLFDEPYPLDDLKEVAKRCSEKERVHFKAESSVVELKKLRLLQQYFEKKSDEIYRGCITKVKPYGIYFEVTPIMIEGFIHVSELGHEYYIYDDRRKTFTGDASGKSYRSGDYLDITLLELDLLLLKTKWALITRTKSSNGVKKSSQKRKKT